MNWIYIVLVLIILYMLRKLYTVRYILFLRPNCPACNEMLTEWSKFEVMAKSNIFPPIETRTELLGDLGAAKLAETYEISGFPQVIRIHPDGKSDTLTKATTAKMLWAYVRNDYATLNSGGPPARLEQSI